MISVDILNEIVLRSNWSVHDIVRLLDFNYSLFRVGIIDSQTMNVISSWLWSLI